MTNSTMVYNGTTPQTVGVSGNLYHNLIIANPADTTPPMVRWTAPTNHAIVGPITASPAFTDSIGPVYAPYVVLGFSETSMRAR